MPHCFPFQVFLWSCRRIHSNPFGFHFLAELVTRPSKAKLKAFYLFWQGLIKHHPDPDRRRRRRFLGHFRRSSDVLTDAPWPGKSPCTGGWRNNGRCVWTEGKRGLEDIHHIQIQDHASACAGQHEKLLLFILELILDIVQWSWKARQGMHLRTYVHMFGLVISTWDYLLCVFALQCGASLIFSCWTIATSPEINRPTIRKILDQDATQCLGQSATLRERLAQYRYWLLIHQLQILLFHV